MVGFAMFYRLLLAELPAKVSGRLPLPQVATETREHIVSEIEEHGSDQFNLSACDQLEEEYPSLLEMAHHFLEQDAQGYLPMMQGYCLVYRSIALQSERDCDRVH